MKRCRPIPKHVVTDEVIERAFKRLVERSMPMGEYLWTLGWWYIGYQPNSKLKTKEAGI